MAAVSIQVGNVTVTSDDEDRGAKSLRKLALVTLADVFETCGGADEDEESDGDG